MSLLRICPQATWRIAGFSSWSLVLVVGLIPVLWLLIPVLWLLMLLVLVAWRRGRWCWCCADDARCGMFAALSLSLVLMIVRRWCFCYCCACRRVVVVDNSNCKVQTSFLTRTTIISPKHHHLSVVKNGRVRDIAHWVCRACR